jgi:hypothetical protein
MIKGKISTRLYYVKLGLQGVQSDWTPYRWLLLALIYRARSQSSPRDRVTVQVDLPDMSQAFLTWYVRLHLDFFVSFLLFLPELHTRDSNIQDPIWHTHVTRYNDPSSSSFVSPPTGAWTIFSYNRYRFVNGWFREIVDVWSEAARDVEMIYWE